MTFIQNIQIWYNSCEESILTFFVLSCLILNLHKLTIIKLTMQRDIEKRKHKRIEKPFIVKLHAIPNKANGRISPDWDMVVAKDLGAGGVFFYSSKNLGIGTALDLKIGFSTSIPPMECIGIVVRVKEQPDTSIFGIATAFTKIGEQEKELINKTAEEVSRQGNQNFAPAFA
jgi:hypothetical protein